VRSLLHHLVFIDDGDGVHVVHGGESVRNDNGGGGATSAGDEAVERVLDESLGLNIQCASGLIEQQDGWIPE
jgi:hypothetical protein